MEWMKWILLASVFYAHLRKHIPAARTPKEQMLRKKVNGEHLLNPHYLTMEALDGLSRKGPEEVTPS